MPEHTAQAVPDATWTAADELVAALAATLRQLADLLRDLTDEQYATKPGGALASSIGGHVRHSLDHVATLLTALPGGALDYDRRARGTAVETDRRAGLAEVRRLEHALDDIDRQRLPAVLKLTLLPAPDRAPVCVSSTPERELAFVLSHAIHHNALVAVLLAAVGGTAPAGFGYAPATIAHQRAQ
jgi:uncharacterized damage-inducible protein DinB